MGLFWWYRGQESTCQCRRHRCNPWLGTSPHDLEQRGPRATTAQPLLPSWRATMAEATDLDCWNLCARSLCSSTGEASERTSPCTATNTSPTHCQLDEARAQQQASLWPKLQNKFLKKTHAPPCSLQHYLQQLGHGRNLDVHGGMNG